MVTQKAMKRYDTVKMKSLVVEIFNFFLKMSVVVIKNDSVCGSSPF